jgi:hypothetical protein
LADALSGFIERPSAHPTFVRREDGKRYTVDGIGAMFRRYCVGTKDRPVDPKHPDFGLGDLREGRYRYVPRRPWKYSQDSSTAQAQSVQTTETYLKGLKSEIVRPNEVPITALVKE